MANHYTDHPELQFELRHPEMERIVTLKELPSTLKMRWIPINAHSTLSEK